uniref:Uncharacterized protein n=1 Tax=Triticum urartu TaxID=4572 RepID=A0A8R7UQR8_TRIUA
MAYGSVRTIAVELFSAKRRFVFVSFLGQLWQMAYKAGIMISSLLNI